MLVIRDGTHAQMQRPWHSMRYIDEFVASVLVIKDGKQCFECNKKDYAAAETHMHRNMHVHIQTHMHF
jgi:hypothetical protein